MGSAQLSTIDTLTKTFKSAMILSPCQRLKEAEEEEGLARWHLWLAEKHSDQAKQQ